MIPVYNHELMEAAAESKPHSHVLTRTGRVVILLAMIGVPVYYGAAWRNILPAMICLFAGLAMRLWSNATLHKSREVTQVGPYSLVRHPMYVGTLLVAAGVVLLWNIPLYWQGAIFGLLVAVHVGRALREERVLVVKHGDTYANYRRRVPLLLPVLSLWRALRGGTMRAGFSWERLKLNGEVRRLGLALFAILLFGAWQVHRYGVQFLRGAQSIAVMGMLGAGCVFFLYASWKVSRVE